MTPQVRAFARGALWALPAWAIMLFLGTLTHQPDPQKDFAGFAAYVTTSSFLWSHLINSITGAAVGSIGVVGLTLYLQDSKVSKRALTGMIATILGNTMVSSIFGVAAFAQTAMGRLFIAGQTNMLDVYNQVYNAPLFLTALVALLFFMAGGIFIGNAIAACSLFPRWTGWLYALGVVGFVLSNFLLDIGQSFSSAFLFLATVTIAWNAGRQTQQQSAQAAVS